MFMTLQAIETVDILVWLYTAQVTKKRFNSNDEFLFWIAIDSLNQIY